MNIFIPALWHDFFIMVGGGAAALTGLVFVAMSINLEVVAHDVTHENRAIGTLTGFTAVFMMCAIALIGNQANQTIGMEWLVILIPATYIYIRGYIRAFKLGSQTGLSVGRTIFGTACYSLQIIGSILFMFGYSFGIYLVSIVMVLAFTSLISGAWLLVLGGHENQHK